MTDENPSDTARSRPGHQSLFFKLFLVLLGSVLVTYLAFGGFYRSFWNASARAEGHKNQIHYSELLSREIGYPPDTLTAARLTEEFGFVIGIKGPSLNWRSEDFSEYVWNRLNTNPPRDSVQVILHGGRVWTIVNQHGYTFIHGSRKRQPGDAMGRDWLALISMLFLAWILSWMTLHRMLKPLQRLEKGVFAVRAGNLDVRLPEEGRDELAELARSFNAMTQSLKERLHARDQLLLDVSHELRSPLTRMRVAIEMAAPGSAVDSLREEVEALEKMVSEILETERLNSPVGQLRREPTDLAALVSENVAQFAGQTPGISWQNREPLILPLEAERMRVVLRNVLDNAFKYGQSASRPVEISLRREGAYAILAVQDFGPGVPEKDLRFVFEPFYRVDRSRSRSPGYGLGLSLCKRVVEMHGGNIFFASSPGEGTRVTIELPLK